MNKKHLGVLYIIVPAFCFALMNTFVRLSGDLPTIQKSFFRNFVAVIFAIIVLKKNHIPMIILYFPTLRCLTKCRLFLPLFFRLYF